MKESLKIVLYVVIFVFLLAVGSVVITDGAEVIAGICEYIMYLFQ